MLRSLYTLRLFLRKFHNFIDAWGERGLAYIINPPIPGKTCFELTARHKNRLLWRGWKSRKKIIFTSFLGQFPCDDTLSVDSHLHYSSCVCLLSVTPSFWFRQELVPCSNFPCILFWDSWFYCQCSMCWVSKLLLLSYYCGNVCLSPPFERWPLPEPADQSGPVEPGNAVVFFCPGPRYIRNIIPFSGEKSLLVMWSDARVCASQVSPGVWWWSQWVIGTTCYEMREGGHTLATIVYVWLVRPVVPVRLVTSDLPGGLSHTESPHWGSWQLPPRPVTLPAMAGLCHWQCLAPALVSTQTVQQVSLVSTPWHATRKRFVNEQ